MSAREGTRAIRFVVLAGLMAIALAAPGAAQAVPGLTTGFSDPALVDGTPSANALWQGRAVAEGAGMVRLSIAWRNVAPTSRPAGFVASDPASTGYDWSSTDAAVRQLTSHGLKVLATILVAPTWAQGANPPLGTPPGTWRPDPTQLASFATAAARRYSGSYADPANPGKVLPDIAYWQGWNEPNLDHYLSPQWTRTRTAWAPTGPALYRSMANAFYKAVKGVSRSNVVVLAGLSPYGDPPGGPRMQPVAFDRSLFCLSGSLKPQKCASATYFDVLDHHPYDIKGPLHPAHNPDDVTVPDVTKLSRVLNAAERAGRALPRGRKPLWVTEISWDSNPPDPGGVPIATQARWLEQSMYVLWRQGVSTFLWLQIVDSPPIPSYAGSYQAGVYYLNGTAKPSATAFRFPFVTSRPARTVVQVWGRSPRSGQLTIEVRRAGRWVVIDRLTARTSGVFVTSLHLSGSVVLRARVGSDTSLTWAQGA